MVRILPVAILACLAHPAAAERAAPPPPAPAPVLKDTFGFDYMKPQSSKCTKITGALLTKLTRSYTCEAVEGGTTASGKPAVARCEVKKGKPSGYVLFKAIADCKEERETQLANGG